MMIRLMRIRDGDDEDDDDVSEEACYLSKSLKLYRLVNIKVTTSLTNQNWMLPPPSGRGSLDQH